MISVCMASYNGAIFIKQQAVSILNQLGLEDELIISDDGSKDNTLEILASLNDSRIKIYHHSAPHGVVSNFENAIKHASGDYIFLSDQDDIWLSNKKEKCLSCLQEYDFISHNAFIVDEHGVLSGKDYFSLRRTRYGYWHNLWKMGYLGCCMAFRRECLKDILPFPKEILWHDMWIASVLHLKYKYNPQIQISAESETKRSIFREKDKTKRSKKESAQHSKSRNKSFVMTSVSAL